jgi:guanylate kinase
MAEAPDLFDHIIVNDNLEQAISELEGLITAR